MVIVVREFGDRGMFGQRAKCISHSRGPCFGCASEMRNLVLPEVELNRKRLQIASCAVSWSATMPCSL
jgi:hypothetical protein